MTLRELIKVLNKLPEEAQDMNVWIVTRGNIGCPTFDYIIGANVEKHPYQNNFTEKDLGNVVVISAD